MTGLSDRTTELGGDDRDPEVVQRTQLVVIHGKTLDGSLSVELDHKPLVIGRQAGPGALGLAEPEASRRHAMVTFDPITKLRSIEDLGSRNGICVNGERVRRAPLANGDVIRLGRTVLLLIELAVDDRPLRPEAPPLLGRSVAMQRLRGEIELVAQRAVSVLVLGETGAGKELVAHELHTRSGRSGAFIPVNCAALPEDLVESELFGDTASGSQGLFGAAGGGTIFLDEISELPAALQPKLLRVLATGEVRPIGIAVSQVIDVRVVAATNRDLAALVSSGAFRADLYSRLAGWTIQVPPLRARRDDILPLALAILARDRPGLLPSADAAEALALHAWPYNVRELEQVLAAAGARIVDGSHLRRQHLPPELTAFLVGRSPSRAAEVELPPVEVVPDDKATPRPDATSIDQLTTRERDVLRGLLEGLSEKEIAAQLDLSGHTVHGHVKAIYRKLGARSRGELLARFVA